MFVKVCSLKESIIIGRFFSHLIKVFLAVSLLSPMSGCQNRQLKILPLGTYPLPFTLAKWWQVVVEKMAVFFKKNYCTKFDKQGMKNTVVPDHFFTWLCFGFGPKNHPQQCMWNNIFFHSQLHIVVHLFGTTKNIKFHRVQIPTSVCGSQFVLGLFTLVLTQAGVVGWLVCGQNCPTKQLQFMVM